MNHNNWIALVLFLIVVALIVFLVLQTNNNVTKTVYIPVRDRLSPTNWRRYWPHYWPRHNHRRRRNSNN